MIDDTWYKKTNNIFYEKILHKKLKNIKIIKPSITKRGVYDYRNKGEKLFFIQ